MSTRTIPPPLAIALVAIALLCVGAFALASSNPVANAQEQPAAADATVTSVTTDVSPDGLDAIVASKISYQGVLREGGAPVTGPRDMRFRLHTNAACTQPAGAIIDRPNVSVINGVFTVELLVDARVVDGVALWLQTQVEGVTIACREILATPYALSLRPAARISDSVPFASPTGFGGAALVVVNSAGRGLYVEHSAAVGSGAAGYFVNDASLSGVYAESKHGTAVTAVGGPDANAFAGDFSGWGGLTVKPTAGTAFRGVDTTDKTVFELNTGFALLTVGGENEDGDVYVTNGGMTRTVQINGGGRELFIFDGVGSDGSVGAGSSNVLLKLDGNTTEPRIYGDQRSNAGNLGLSTRDDLRIYLDSDNSQPFLNSARFEVVNSAGTTVCSISESGTLTCTGAKNALVDTASFGQRRLTAIESPGVWFEDVGSARLVAGVAVVTLDPIFVETVNTGVEYHVFVTPLGGWAGLYVAEKGATSFTVVAGAGDPNVAFDYRILAKRLGYEEVRLPPPEDQSGDMPASVVAASTEPDDIPADYRPVQPAPRGPESD